MSTPYIPPYTANSRNLTVPYNNVAFEGSGILRSVTVVMPSSVVRNLLPPELDLGFQDLTPRGTHPVIFFFHDMVGAHLSIPSILPGLTYHEQIVGIPYTTVKTGTRGSAPVGPCFFMPHLFLDDYIATMGGRLWWGFAKTLARIDVTANSFEVTSNEGDPIMKMEFETDYKFRPVAQYPLISHAHNIMSQPLISRLPMGYGPFLACSNFDKDWIRALVSPLNTVLHIYRSFIPGLPTGCFPTYGRTVGIDEAVLGSFSMQTSWRQGPLYPCAMAGSF